MLEAIADDPEGRPADRVRAVDLLGRLGGVAKDEPIPNELVRLLAMDVGAVARSADFGGTDDAEGFLSHVYDRWAVTLGAFRNLSTTMGHSTGLIKEQFPVWRGVWWED